MRNSRIDSEIPAAVTDYSSYELGIITERERCTKIAESYAMKWDIACSCAEQIANEIQQKVPIAKTSQPCKDTSSEKQF